MSKIQYPDQSPPSMHRTLVQVIQEFERLQTSTTSLLQSLNAATAGRELGWSLVGELFDDSMAPRAAVETPVLENDFEHMIELDGVFMQFAGDEVLGSIWSATLDDWIVPRAELSVPSTSSAAMFSGRIYLPDLRLEQSVHLIESFLHEEGQETAQARAHVFRTTGLKSERFQLQASSAFTGGRVRMYRRSI